MKLIKYKRVENAHLNLRGKSQCPVSLKATVVGIRTVLGLLCMGKGTMNDPRRNVVPT
jgi:hypothetical protein